MGIAVFGRGDGIVQAVNNRFFMLTQERNHDFQLPRAADFPKEIVSQRKNFLAQPLKAGMLHDMVKGVLSGDFPVTAVFVQISAVGARHRR